MNDNNKNLNRELTYNEAKALLTQMYNNDQNLYEFGKENTFNKKGNNPNLKTPNPSVNNPTNQPKKPINK